MVSRTEDSIDFQKLESDVHAAVDADTRYWTENDAKFRAVNQKVATYEEFRDIVLASHLKPIDKGEGLESMQQRKQPWNQMAQSGATQGSSKHTATDGKNWASKKPSNALEFSRAWSRSCKTDVEKYSYLMWIGPKILQTIFKTEISFGLLGDILVNMDANYQADHCLHAVAIMQTLSQSKRIKLSVDFLSDKEKCSCRNLFEKLERDIVNVTSCSLCEEGTQCLSDVSTELVSDLMQMYKITT